VAIRFNALLACVAAVLFQGGAAAGGAPIEGLKLRCGWWDNPTPSNVSFFDSEGEWTISRQGGLMKAVPGAQPDKDGFVPMEARPYPITQDDNVQWPAFKRSQKVRVNGEYGYGCVCASMQVDQEARVVIELRNAKARSLSYCRADRSLLKYRKQGLK
jgi:Protein of unknown function (DUF4087)